MSDESNRTVSDVFDVLGGPAKVARGLGLKGASTASEMKRRGKIGVEYFPGIVSLAEAEGIAWLTYEALVLMHARKSPAAGVVR